MKLPDIQYTTRVQTLGRHDVAAPGRVATAQAKAATAVAQSLSDMQDMYAVIEYTKKIGQAKTDVNDLFTIITSKEAFTQDEIPDFVTVERFEKGYDEHGNVIDIEREFIPASEIREDWMKKGLQNIQEAVLSGTLTAPARARLKLELSGTIGPQAYAAMQKYHLAILKSERKAEMEAAVQDAVVNGDRIGVEAILIRYKESGLITVNDYVVRQLRASQELDIEAYSKDIMQAKSLGDLQSIQDSLSINKSLTGLPGESDLTATQRNTLRVAGKAKQQEFIDARNEIHRQTEQEALSRFVDGDLSLSDIQDYMDNDRMDRPAGQSLINLMNQDVSHAIINDAKVAGWYSEVQRRLMFTDFGVQTSDVARAMRKELMYSGMNGSERKKVLEYIDKVDQDIRNNPAYKQAFMTIRLATSMPEADDTVGLMILQATGKFRLVKQATEDFTNALFQYIDEFGAEAKPFEFVQKNKDKYKIEDMEKTLQERFEQEFPQFIPGTSGVIDPEIVLNQLYKQYQTGDESVAETIQQVWTFWYGTSLDLNSAVFN